MDAPSVLTGPRAGSALDYSRRDYEGLRAIMLRELARSLPTGEWGHPADPMTVLVEVLAAAGDYLSYRLDSAATEAYLATARLRSSVRRHARLLDYHLNDGCSARAWLTCEVSQDCILPARTLAATRQDDLAEVIPTASQVDYGSDTIFFETVAPALLRAKDFELRTDARALAAGAVEAVIAAPPRPLLPGDLVIFRGPSRAQVVRTVDVRPLDGDTVALRWGQEDALGDDLPVEGLRVSGNVVPADHGRSFRFALDEHHSVTATFADLSRTPPDRLSRLQPAAAAPDPRSARPDIVVMGDDGDWSAVRDLIGAGRFARIFVAEQEDEGRVRLRFGDGLFGRAPGPLAGATVIVRQGVGSRGNVLAGALGHIVTDAPVTAVAQPFAAVGGTEPEATGAARLYAPMACGDPAHIASAADAAAIAANHPLVARATATVVARKFQVYVEPHPTVSVERAVAAVTPYLCAALVLGCEVEVSGPVPVAIDVTLQVRPAPGSEPDLLQAKLAGRFERRLGAPPALLFGIAYPMGAPVFFSDLVQAVLEVEGVGSVDLAGDDTRFVAPASHGHPGQEGLARGYIAPGANEIAAAGTVIIDVAGMAER
jgi:hypothetical protein